MRNPTSHYSKHLPAKFVLHIILMQGIDGHINSLSNSTIMIKEVQSLLSNSI